MTIAILPWSLKVVKKDNYKLLDRYYMEKAKASCPASISFLFKVCPDKNLLKMGSIGVSCTIDKKVYVEVEEAKKTEIFFNGIPVKFPTVSYIIDKLTNNPVKVSIESSLPLGYGFSISGASALSSAFAINNLFHLKKTRDELIKLAHIAEIVNHTGLGNIGTQTTGGFLLKNKPGLPVVAIKLPFVGKKLYAIIIGKLLTPSILKDNEKMQEVNSVTDIYLKMLKKNKSLQLSDVLDASFEFVEKTGLLTDKRVTNIIRKIKKAGGSATMAILGKVIITNIKPTFIKAYKTVELTITNEHV